MFLGLGREAISIMFAIFSVGVTLFASSPQFIFDNGEDDNHLRKLNFVVGFDIHDASLYEIEKFILYNSDLALDKRILKYDADLDYRESLNFYYHTIDAKSHLDERMLLPLHLAIVPVFYNSGNPEVAREILDDKVKPFFSEKDENKSIDELMQNEKDGILNSDDILLMKYRYADYATQRYTEDKPKEFPGCDTSIFNDKINPFGNIHKDNNKPKCTHKELKFIDDIIYDLNYDSYKFDVGNKYQKDTKVFYQDEIKTFFESYMNWLIIGVVLVVLVGWTAMTNRETIRV